MVSSYVNLLLPVILPWFSVLLFTIILILNYSISCNRISSFWVIYLYLFVIFSFVYLGPHHFRNRHWLLTAKSLVQYHVTTCVICNWHSDTGIGLSQSLFISSLVIIIHHCCILISHFAVVLTRQHTIKSSIFKFMVLSRTWHMDGYGVSKSRFVYLFVNYFRPCE